MTVTTGRYNVNYRIFGSFWLSPVAFLVFPSFGFVSCYPIFPRCWSLSFGGTTKAREVSHCCVTSHVLSTQFPLSFPLKYFRHQCYDMAAAASCEENSSAKKLKLVVFGATGRTGKEVVKQALKKGHHVTAVVRTPEKLNIQ